LSGSRSHRGAGVLLRPWFRHDRLGSDHAFRLGLNADRFVGWRPRRRWSDRRVACADCEAGPGLRCCRVGDIHLGVAEGSAGLSRCEPLRGAGALGRDVIGLCSPHGCQGVWDNYQCKHYEKALGVRAAPRRRELLPERMEDDLPRIRSSPQRDPIPRRAISARSSRYSEATGMEITCVADLSAHREWEEESPAAARSLQRGGRQPGAPRPTNQHSGRAGA
jgi:hypothetical protein